MARDTVDQEVMDEASMDQETIQIGLLMEAAQSHQSLAQSSLEKLEASVQGLDYVVRDEIRRTLTAELAEQTQAIERTTEALRAARQVANLRLILWSVGISVLSGVAPMAVAFWMLPSQAEISRLRADRDRLAQNVVRLRALGAGIELRHCGVGQRLCVRIDRKAPVYGEKSDYVVLQGY